MKIIFLSQNLRKKIINLVLFYFKDLKIPIKDKRILGHKKGNKENKSNSICERHTHLVYMINNVKTQLIMLFAMCSTLGSKLFKHISSRLTVLIIDFQGKLN